jgi:hypothetical protein
MRLAEYPKVGGRDEAGGLGLYFDCGPMFGMCSRAGGGCGGTLGV